MNTKPVIIAHHLILTGYGHWLPNDPRGSGSNAVHMPHLADLGEPHFGRKRLQPLRQEVRDFYAEANPRLKHEKLWFDDAKRQAIGESFQRTCMQCRYTVYACAILRNHAHLCVRRHRDDAITIRHAFADRSKSDLADVGVIDPGHPLWSARPSKVFLHTPDDVRRVIRYINENPEKEHLAPQTWSFVTTYDGWPFRKENLGKPS